MMVSVVNVNYFALFFFFNIYIKEKKYFCSIFKLFTNYGFNLLTTIFNNYLIIIISSYYWILFNYS